MTYYRRFVDLFLPTFRGTMETIATQDEPAQGIEKKKEMEEKTERETERERERERKRDRQEKKGKGETARFFLPRRKNCVAHCRPVPIVEQSR